MRYLYNAEKFKKAATLVASSKGMTQGEFAIHIGEDAPGWSRYLNGKKPLTPRVVGVFCDASEGRYTPEDFMTPSVNQSNVNGDNINGTNITLKKVSGDEVHNNDMTNTKLYNDMLLVIENMASELSEVHKEMKNYDKYIDRCLSHIDDLRDERNSLRKEIECLKDAKKADK